MARSGWPPCLAAHRDAVPRSDAIGFPTALCQRGGFSLPWLAPDDAISMAWREALITCFREHDMPMLSPPIPATNSAGYAAPAVAGSNWRCPRRSVDRRDRGSGLAQTSRNPTVRLPSKVKKVQVRARVADRIDVGPMSRTAVHPVHQAGLHVPVPHRASSRPIPLRLLLTAQPMAMPTSTQGRKSSSRCPQRSPSICAKCPSRVSSAAPNSSALAAIHKSLVGIGWPLRRRPE